MNIINNLFIKKLLTIFMVGFIIFLSGCMPVKNTNNEIIIKKLPFKLDNKKQSQTVLVKFKKNVSSDTKDQVLKKQAGPVISRIPELNVYEKKVASIQIRNVISSLRKQPSVQYVEENKTRRVLISPNDRYYSRQYGLRLISAPYGWNIERGSSNVTIAIVDTGVDLSHPDLRSKIIRGYDFINNDSNPSDDHGHGTHVAGIASAVTNNAVGVAGVNWRAKIMPVKVLDAGGSGTDLTVANGVIFAADNGAKVINMSLGGYGFSQTLQDATDYAYSRGVVVLAAAGNEGSSDILYPAGNRNVLGIGALDTNGKIADFSNHNSSVDLSAPGVDVLSTYWHGGHSYAYMSGTSMATPFASGAASLLFNKLPGSSSSQIISRLCRQSIDLGSLGRDSYYGEGRIDLQFCLSNNSRRIVAFRNKSRIRRRQRVKIYGQVRPLHSGYRVTIKMRYSGSRRWSVVTRLRTNGHGRFAKYIRLRRTAYFRVICGNTKSLKVKVVK